MLLRRRSPWRDLERTLGHRFRDRSLLETALTHPSFRGDPGGGTGTSNQRLEFLGDAVLGLIVAESLYRAHDALDEGGLSVLRSRVTSGKALADAARRIGLGRWLRLGRSEDRSGVRDRDSALTDALEALIGAVWLDGGARAACKVVAALGLEPCRDPAIDVWAGNPKGRLQEVAQRRHQAVPVYTLCGQKGPPHCPAYRVRVSVGAGLAAEGEGPTKRAAEAAAADQLLRHPGVASDG